VFLGNGLGTPVAPENSRSFAALESREWIAAAALTTDGRRATGDGRRASVAQWDVDQWGVSASTEHFTLPTAPLMALVVVRRI